MSTRGIGGSLVEGEGKFDPKVEESVSDKA